MKYLLILFLGCALGKQAPHQDLNQMLAGRAQSLVSQEVKSRDEAEQILLKKYTYHQALFEQSYDPYYGTPRWDEQCLKENQIRPVKKLPKISYLSMTLVMNDREEVGLCSKATNASPVKFKHLIYYHCHGVGVISRLLVNAESSDQIDLWEQLCEK